MESTEIVAPEGGSVMTLPSGFKVALRNPQTFRNRDRKRVLSRLNPEAEGSEKVRMALDLADELVVALITDWDVREVDLHGTPVGDVLPLPTDAEGLDDLTVPDITALSKVGEEARKVIFPDFDASGDPESPTSTSAG